VVATYEPESNYADDVHEDVSTFAEDNGVEGNERLRRAELKKLIRGGLGLG
jgi:hypothetical protein